MSKPVFSNEADNKEAQDTNVPDMGFVAAKHTFIWLCE